MRHELNQTKRWVFQLHHSKGKKSTMEVPLKLGLEHWSR
ncbi:hypothetical protein GQ55_3G100000 [Panicum hallii var. hallii]|uniref:Uncharacterized protein n=2 Tax=Panicum hallii TaxID=206008 RepID=A0A2T7E7Q4_9POAL|nr:hypothetical protein PAHAL_3G105700 [Panicum hallii]PUZ63853.1 hypothetical protein GQ55_3G100000 [Panicum hallii var. hallii]